MTLRDLFTRIMRFEPVDRTPLLDLEGVTAQAERKWVRDEGVPLDRTGAGTIPFDGRLVSLHFGDQPPLPTFAPGTLREDQDYTYSRDVFGFTVKTEKGSVLTPVHYLYVDAPLRSLDDWRAMAKRFDPTDSRRLPIWWSADAIRQLNDSPAPVVISMNWGPARGIKNYYMFGLDRFVELLVAEPNVLEAVFGFWADFLIEFLSQFIDSLAVDAFIFSEDGMGFKHSTMVSPSMFERIYAPHMAKVTDFLRSKGVEIVGYYSSGNLEPLIPSFLRAGISLVAPLECAAGMDAVRLRNQYGRDLRLVGNISREAIMQGKDAVRREVDYKVPVLMEKGGYIPGFDDMIMPDVTLENVRYCAHLIKSYCPGKAGA